MEGSRLFPHWHALSLLDDSWWSTDLDLADSDVFFRILGHMVDDQASTSREAGMNFFRLCEAITSDIIELQSNGELICDPINLQYLQFESSIMPFKLAIDAGELHTAHDWILNGFDTSVSDDVVREFHADRVINFLESKVPWITGNRQNSLSDWFISFFYYCRVRGALYETAETLIGAALKVADSFLPYAPPSIEIMRSLLDWSSSQDHETAPHIAAWLEEAFHDPTISLQQQAQIAISFSTIAGRFASRPPKEWAEWALKNARSELTQHEPFQLLLTTVETKADWLRLRGPIRAELEQSIQQFLLEHRSPTSAAIMRERRCDLLNPIVFNTHRFGLRDDLLLMFYTWYQISTDHRMESDVFFLLPNHIAGMAYLGTNSTLFGEAEWRHRIIDIIGRTNEALGITLSVQGANLPAEAPDRQGVPDYDKAQDFEQVLKGFYQFEHIPAASVTDAQAMVSFPAYPHPIQGMMRSVIGQTWPISASLEGPDVDRSINSVGVWYTSNDFYSEMEAEAISNLLTEAKIHVSLESGHEKSKDDFLQFYQDRGFDLIWVAGHGVYNHWDPMSPAVLFGDSSQVLIDEILGCDIVGSGRRLLVLNICDGGGTAVLGGIHKVGLAAMLASRKQAVVSHHWPVEPRVAAAFGLMFACFLITRQTSFFQSFQEALDWMKRPWRDIVEEISEHTQGDLVDRLVNANFDTSNVFHWGSPCFYQ